MAVQLVARGKSIREQVSAAEWSARVELAARSAFTVELQTNEITAAQRGGPTCKDAASSATSHTPWRTLRPSALPARCRSGAPS